MPLLKEWADLLLFANYKTKVVNVDNQGATKGKNKAQGNQRIMYANRTPWWDAKNRHSLPDEMEFKFQPIAHCLMDESIKNESNIVNEIPIENPQVETIKDTMETPKDNNNLEGVPKELADLMLLDNITVADIQKIVGQKGYYPADTPIHNYDADFIQGVLVRAWEQVKTAILATKEITEKDVMFK